MTEHTGRQSCSQPAGGFSEREDSVSPHTCLSQKLLCSCRSGVGFLGPRVLLHLGGLFRSLQTLGWAVMGSEPMGTVTCDPERWLSLQLV